MFKIIDVKGDGHCYYRCIWNIARHVPDIAEALMVSDLKNDLDGALEVRYYIALSIRFELFAKNIVNNLVSLYKESPDLVHQYPVLSHIKDMHAAWDEIYRDISNAIEHTNVMASELEHEIITERLCDTVCDPPLDIRLVALTKLGHENIEDLADKWLRQLAAMIDKIDENYVIVIINEDNIHYKYTKIFGKVMVDTSDLREYVKTKMAESSDEDD
jgi:hypothetical protein